MKWYWKVLIAVSLVLIVSILSADYVASVIIDKKVKLIQKELEGQYNFDYSKLKVSIIKKEISLKGFTFETVLDSVNTHNKLDLKLKKLVFKFNNYREVLIEGKLRVKKIILNQPTIYYGLKKKLHKDNVEENAFDAQPEIEDDLITKNPNDKLLRLIVFESIELKKGKAEIFHLDEPDNDVLKIEDADLMVENLRVDLTAANIEAMLKSDEFNLSLIGVSTDELKNQSLTIGKIEFKLSSKLLSISDFHIKNKKGTEAFASSQKYRSPWLDISVSEIDIHMNPWHLYRKGVIYFKKVEIDGVKAALYNDITLELNSSHKPMPSRAIRDINIPFKIDSLIIKDSELVYKHKGKAKKPGVLEFNSLNVAVSNITNIDYVIENDPMLVIDIKAKLWDAGKLDTKISIDLKNKKDIVYAVGTLSNMSLKKAENMIKPLYGVEITSGYIDRLHYDFVMNEDIGKGKLKFDYKEMKVDIKKNENDNKNVKSSEHKSSKFFSFVANEAVIANNIPGSKGYIHNGLMIFDRTKNKPIFDLYWHCIQVGLMDIVVPDILYKAEANYYKKEKKKEKQVNKDKTKKNKKRSKKKN